MQISLKGCEVKMKCDNCGKDIRQETDKWSVCDKCGDNLCDCCIENHEC